MYCYWLRRDVRLDFVTLHEFEEKLKREVKRFFGILNESDKV